MLTGLVDRLEGLVLRTAPAQGPRVMGRLPPSVLAGMQASRFRRTLRLAARAPFYREAFRKRGIRVESIRHPAQLGDFYTTGEDIRAGGPEAFLVGRPDTAFETTGTTSPVPKRVFFANDEINGMGAASAAALHLLGMRRDDRVLTAFDCSFWVSPAVARSAMQYIGCFQVEAGKIDPVDCYEHASRYRPNVIFGEPSWIVRFSEVAAERGSWPMKLMIVGGENLAETARREVETVWSAPLYMNYGQTEGFGSLGLECRAQQGYHRNDLHFQFEIDAPDSEGYGELIYTTLTRHVMPLIRYRSSDVTRLVDEPCPCGLFARRLARIRARCDEMVVCGMGNVGPWVFDEILRGIPAADEWQVRVRHDGRLDVIVLEAEQQDGSRVPEFEQGVLHNLRDRFPDFWKNRAMGLYDLEIKVVPPGTLRAHRKLRRVVDQRSEVQAADRLT